MAPAALRKPEPHRFPRYRLVPRDEGYMPYVWLVYMATTFVYPAAGDSLSGLVATAAGAVVFLPLYFRAYWVCGRTLLGLLICMAAIGAFVAPFNPVASVYFCYAASFAPFVASTELGWRIIIGLLAAIALEAAVLHLTPFFWLPGTVFTTLVGAAVSQAAKMQKINADLRAAREDAERLAKLAERERIARDLHDVLGHTLSVIVLKAELAAKVTASAPGRAAEEMRDVERIARRSLAEVREALADYRTTGMSAEIVRARDALSAAGVRFECDIADVRLAPRTESVIALAIREAVTNVVRHARASSCRVSLQDDAEHCRLRIDDDGTGFVGNGRPAAMAEGWGLRGMRERVEALGGTLVCSGTNGTQLELTLPASAS